MKAPTYETKRFGDVSSVDSVAIYNDETDEVTLFAVNKDLEEDVEVSMDLRQFAGMKVLEHAVLEHEDLFAINTEADPDNVKPHSGGKSAVTGGTLTAILPKKSWNMIRLGK